MSRVVLICNTSIYFVRFRRELVDRLHALDHEVVLIAPRDRRSHMLREWPLRWIEWPLAQHGMNPLMEMRAFLFLVRQVRRLRPDYIVNFTIKPSIYGSIAGRMAACPRIVSIFTGLGHLFTDPKRVMQMQSRWIETLLHHALRHNAKVFFQNTDDSKLFVDRQLVHPRQVELLPGSGVNLVEFSPRSLPRNLHFLMIGRPLAEKGVYDYISAARLIKAKYPQVRFSLAGGADHEPSAVSSVVLNEWVKEGVIEYFGEVEDVRPLIEQATAVILPSYREGTPRSLLEALAMQRAVITCDSPGCRETAVDGLNGFLVPVRDPVRLAAAIERIVAEPALAERMGKESRRMAVARFDVNAVNAQLLAAIGLTPVDSGFTPP